ncbi:MAG: c-type cytochrome [Gammaproteobacteria bacterium]|nr:c-type cytochrome [Gammaproteobacteria bacterium]
MSSVTLAITSLVLLLSSCGGGAGGGSTEGDNALAELGEKIYFDTNLSNPVGQSCASCHLPSAGFADPDNTQPTSEGAVSGRFVSRNTPTSSYAAHIPEFGFRSNNRGGGSFFGGQFLDGRVNTLEEQAQLPFLGELEMNMDSEEAVVNQVAVSDYADEFTAYFGANALDSVESAYDQIAEAIAEFERSDFFSPFNSRFDDVAAGSDVFSVAEQNGRELFSGKANCNRCHESNGRGPELFSDFSFRNIGVPANPNNPFLTLDASFNPDGTNFVDLGLGAVLDDSSENGKFKTPTLRNIALTAPYMHNGVFNTLTEVVEFYNRRDVDNIAPEVNENIDNTDNMGNLGLTNDEVADLVAFMQTLSDH